MKIKYFLIFVSLLFLSIVIPIDATLKHQIQSGTIPLDVVCGGDTVLVIRPSGDSIVCLSEDSSTILALRGWIPINTIEFSPNHYTLQIKDLKNSIYLFENKTVTVSGVVHPNDIAMPLVQCNYDNSVKTILEGYVSDRNSPYFITDGMDNSIGIRISYAGNNTISINHNDFGKNTTITGVIHGTEFAPDYCNSNVLQKSAYFEVLSIRNP
jgi:hypothetical protein